MKDDVGLDLMADAKFYMGYSRWDEELGRYEYWDESVERVMNMHREKYANIMTPELNTLIGEAEQAYKNKESLGAQRALQFGGPQIFKHEAKLYNCSSSPADRPKFFQEAMFLLLCGVGVGFSVQKHHVAQIPRVLRRNTNSAKVFVVPDSIEGWGDAFGVLISSYLEKDAPFPEYQGVHVKFDYSKIRPRGSLISGGFTAPGHEGLEKALIKCEKLIEGALSEGSSTQLRPIHVYDFVMHMADAVLSGGVRRSATICLFSKDDQEMVEAKTGNWGITNPQRGRSNNSAVIVRGDLTESEWENIFKSVRQFGEPGFFFTENEEFSTNPCVAGDTPVFVRSSTDWEQEYYIHVKDLVEEFNAHEKSFQVFSYNVETKQIEWKNVTNAQMTKRNAEVLVLSTTGEIGHAIKCTPDHKIYTVEEGFIEAKHTFGKTVVTEAGEHEKVASLILLSEKEDVYDITVQGNHNFFGNGILVHNCVEIGMLPRIQRENGEWESGFQFCNLTEINGAKCDTPEDFYKHCRTAAILGTLQAGYTNFTYVSNATREITEREALLGVSITGWMNNPDVLFDPEVLARGAEVVKQVNAKMAPMLGINQAARTTCAKPAGTTSIFLKTASGIHPEHSPRYFRNMQINKDSAVGIALNNLFPEIIEESTHSANNTDYVFPFPIVAKEGSKYKKDLTAIDMLEKIKLAQEYWVNSGTNEELCVDPRLKHNISNTVTVRPDEWEEVEKFIFENRNYYAGISLLGSYGDKDFNQAPFTEVLTEQELVDTYGLGAMFASGLIVDALHVFDEDLWLACTLAMQRGVKLEGTRTAVFLKKDWLRRAKKFARNYFDGDLQRMTYCLKDCNNLHKWQKITRRIHTVDFVEKLYAPEVIAADTLGSQACAGGACEI